MIIYHFYEIFGTFSEYLRFFIELGFIDDFSQNSALL